MAGPAGAAWGIAVPRVEQQYLGFRETVEKPPKLTPPKINMEPENDGFGSDDFPFDWVIF